MITVYVFQVNLAIADILVVLFWVTRNPSFVYICP